MIFIIDTNIESLAVKEAIKLKIPIAAILDTNSDPTDIQFPIPGNDDARRSINLYCDLLKNTIIDASKIAQQIAQQNADKKVEIKVGNKVEKKIEKKVEEKKSN